MVGNSSTRSSRDPRYQAPVESGNRENGRASEGLVWGGGKTGHVGWLVGRHPGPFVSGVVEQQRVVGSVRERGEGRGRGRRCA